ncbi:hypothetical protein KQX54_001518 [Cotesia glomerata]|uniref:Uncharacterized protein n=1 Tax=Cotesia glomerata TaxID=32391 RepID=A0AAV7IXL8_COTGL|nr:hypothetical protein KQX54_001518 [Cotesia glomerata]
MLTSGRYADDEFGSADTIPECIQIVDQANGLCNKGQFNLKKWCSNNPRILAYVALFICAATSFIHLELVTAYTDEAFVAAYKRFVGIYGSCQTSTLNINYFKSSIQYEKKDGCEKEQLKCIQSDNEHEKRARESAPILGQRAPGALQAPDLPPSGEVEKPLVVLVGNGWEVEREI